MFGWKVVYSVPRSVDPEIQPTQEEIVPPNFVRGAASGNTAFCPQKANVFPLTKGRKLTVRRRCEGRLLIQVRQPDGSETILNSDFYGKPAEVIRATQVNDRFVVLAMEKTETVVLLVDLEQGPSSRMLRLPKDFAGAKGLRINVAAGIVYVSGGVRMETVGSGGTEQRKPGDPFGLPYLIQKERPNLVVLSFNPG